METPTIENFRHGDSVGETHRISEGSNREIKAEIHRSTITLDEVLIFHPEPELFYGSDEAAPLDRTETKAQEEQRSERNKQRRKRRRLRTTKRGDIGKRVQGQA